MLMVPVCPESGFLGRAVRPRTARQTTSRSSVMNAASALYPAALASVGCGTGGAVTYSWGRILAGRVRVFRREPGQLRVDLPHHGPDGGDPCLQGRRIRALAVGVELVDGLGQAPERGFVYRTHHRRLSGRRPPPARLLNLGYPQVGPS